ncbi:DUF2894 domain-containing protein [Eionea flava]
MTPSSQLSAKSILPISVEALASLKQKGFHRYDVVAFAGIESLVSRAAAQREKVRVLVLNKAQQALNRYVQQYKLDERIVSDQAIVEDTAANDVRLSKSTHSKAINALVTLRKYVDGLHVEPELEKADSVTQSAVATSTEHAASTVLPALKSSAAYYRLQHQQRVDQFMDTALNAKPETPGPLNPETLAIRLLSQIHDLSPEYIRHYVTYFDTLQWLHNNIPPNKVAK